MLWILVSTVFWFLTDIVGLFFIRQLIQAANDELTAIKWNNANLPAESREIRRRIVIGDRNLSYTLLATFILVTLLSLLVFTATLMNHFRLDGIGGYIFMFLVISPQFAFVLYLAMQANNRYRMNELARKNPKNE